MQNTWVVGFGIILQTSRWWYPLWWPTPTWRCRYHTRSSFLDISKTVFSSLNASIFHPSMYFCHAPKINFNSSGFEMLALTNFGQPFFKKTSGEKKYVQKCWVFPMKRPRKFDPMYFFCPKKGGNHPQLRLHLYDLFQVTLALQRCSDGEFGVALTWRVWNVWSIPGTTPEP